MRTFKRWELVDNFSVAALVQGDRCGVYVLEFKDGSQYVGQSVEVVTRFATHVHGSSHHAPWEDIVALSFMEVPRDELDDVERTEILRRQNQGIELRNKAMNPLHRQPSPFDEVLTVEEQRHWANGYAEYGWEGELPSVEGASKLKSWGSKKGRKNLYEAALRDLKFLIENVIPNPADTEGTYWTISDFPSTAGGRLATLNAGRLELAYFPKRDYAYQEFSDLNIFNPNEPYCVVNMIPIVYEDMEPLRDESGNVLPREETYWYSEDLRYVLAPRRYPLLEVDGLLFPVGHAEEIFTSIEEFLPHTRELALILMRDNQSGMFRRWHSSVLLSEIFGS